MRNEPEPPPREVRIVQKGPLRVTMPTEDGPALLGAVVERTLREIRERGD